MSAQPPPPPQPPYGRPTPPQPAQRPPPPGFSVDGRELRPRRFWYWIAGLLAIGSIAAAVALFVSAGDNVDSLTDVVSELTPLDAPGETTVTLEAGDEQAIYRQVRSAVGPIGSGPGDASRLRCQVTDPSGGPVGLGQSLGISTLSLNRERYVAEFNFDAAVSGEYRVACLTPRGAALSLLIGPEIDIGEVFGLVGGVFGGIAILALGLIGAIAIVIPVAIMRSNHKRRLAREAAAAGI